MSQMSEMPLWGKIALGAAGVLLLGLLIAQLVLPGIAAGEIEDELTENGGSAEVDVSAFPAASLIFRSGNEVTVRGSGLAFELETGDKPFDRVDGFDEVDVDLDNFTVGPAEVSDFVLTRSGDDPYALELHMTMTPAAMATIGGAAFGAGPLGALFSNFLLGDAANTSDIPVDLQVEVESEEDSVTVVSGTAEIAGFDARPLAELIAAAVAVRL